MLVLCGVGGELGGVIQFGAIYLAAGMMTISVFVYQCSDVFIK